MITLLNSSYRSTLEIGPKVSRQLQNLFQINNDCGLGLGLPAKVNSEKEKEAAEVESFWTCQPVAVSNYAELVH